MIVKREQHNKFYSIEQYLMLYFHGSLFSSSVQRGKVTYRILQYLAVNYGKARCNTLTHSVPLKTACRIPKSALIFSPD